MTIGSAIAASSLFIGLILLYGFTKDRINWRRGIKRVSIGALALIFLCILAGTGIYYWNEYQNRPTKFTELWKIKLGETESDIVFHHGQPSWTCTNPTDAIWKALWFVSDSHSVRVSLFDSNARRIIIIGDMLEAELDEGHSMVRYSNSASLIERWGAPSKMSESEDKTSRSYVFEAFNFGVNLELDKPHAIQIYDPSYQHKGVKSGDDDPNFDKKKTKCVDKDGKPAPPEYDLW